MVTTRGRLDWSGCPLMQCDPQRMGGVPTIDGMRITPETVVDNYEDGLSVVEITDQFPSLIEQQVRIILGYGEKRGFLTRPAA